jgi:hypothetical protein
LGMLRQAPPPPRLLHRPLLCPYEYVFANE